MKIHLIHSLLVQLNPYINVQLIGSQDQHNLTHQKINKSKQPISKKRGCRSVKKSKLNLKTNKSRAKRKQLDDIKDGNSPNGKMKTVRKRKTKTKNGQQQNIRQQQYNIKQQGKLDREDNNDLNQAKQQESSIKKQNEQQQSQNMQVQQDERQNNQEHQDDNNLSGSDQSSSVSSSSSSSSSLSNSNQLNQQQDFIQSSNSNNSTQYQSTNYSFLKEQFRVQLLNQEQFFSKFHINKSQMEPRTEQLEQSLLFLSENMPTINHFKVIKDLYKHLMPKNLNRSRGSIYAYRQNKQSLCQALYKRSPFYKIQNNIAKIESLEDYRGFTKAYPKQNFIQKHYQTPYDNYKYKLKCLAARSFCFGNHSLSSFRKEAAQSGDNIRVDSQKYKVSLQNIVIEAYRFLQQFIIKDCKINIQPLVRNQIRLICARLFHCRQTLNKELYTAFLNIIKILYGVSDVILEEFYMIKLYWATQKGLRLICIKKIKGNNIAQPQSSNIEDAKTLLYQSTVQEDQRTLTDTQSIWTLKMERQFLLIYKQTQQFVYIKRYFSQKYPQYYQFFKGNGLKNRLNQILRTGISKVRIIHDRFKGTYNSPPPLIKMDDEKIKYIMKAARAQKARLIIIQIYQDDEQTLSDLIFNAILEINTVLKTRPPKGTSLYANGHEDLSSNNGDYTEQQSINGESQSSVNPYDLSQIDFVSKKPRRKQKGKKSQDAYLYKPLRYSDAYSSHNDSNMIN